MLQLDKGLRITLLIVNIHRIPVVLKSLGLPPLEGNIYTLYFKDLTGQQHYSKPHSGCRQAPD